MVTLGKSTEGITSSQEAKNGATPHDETQRPSHERLSEQDVKKRRLTWVLALVGIAIVAVAAAVTVIILMVTSNESDGGEEVRFVTTSEVAPTPYPNLITEMHANSTPYACSKYYALEDVYVAPNETEDEEDPNTSFDGSEPPPDVSDPAIGVPGVKAWAKARTERAAAEFKGRRMPSPDWSSSVIYNIQMDRFNNGDTSNDNANIQSQQQEDVSNRYYRADMRGGGDIAGVLQRLPYIQELGMNTIWLTPIHKHDGAYHGYCTADITEVDPGLGTPELLRELVAEAHRLGIRVVIDIVANHMCEILIDAEEGENRTRYEPMRNPGDPEIVYCTDSMEKAHWDADDGIITNQTTIIFSRHFFAPFRTQEFFNRCGPNTEKSMTGTDPITVYGDFAFGLFDYNTRNPDWQMIFTELLKYWIAFADVDGFRIDAAKHISEDFTAYMSTEVRRYAQCLGKDNFYIIGEVAATVDWQGRRLGMMSSDPDEPSKHDMKLGLPKTLTKTLVKLKPLYKAHKKFPYPGLGAVYNFYQSGKGKAALLGWDDDGLQAYVGTIGWYFDDGLQEMSSVMGQTQDCCAEHKYGCSRILNNFWTVIEIHDWPRFATFYPTEKAMAKVGLAWVLTTPGQPVIHYGAEQGFTGKCPEEAKVDAGGGNAEIFRVCQLLQEDPYGHLAIYHPFFRQDMYEGGPFQLGSLIPELNESMSINIDRLLTPQEPHPDWRTDPYLRRDHDLFHYVRKLSKLRQSCAAMKRGYIKWGYEGLDNRPPRSVFSFSRFLDKEVVVVINPNSEPAQLFQFLCLAQLNKAGDIYRDVLDPDPLQTFSVQITEDNRCLLNPNKYLDGVVDAYKIRILVKEEYLIKREGNVFYDPEYDYTAFCDEEEDVQDGSCEEATPTCSSSMRW